MTSATERVPAELDALAGVRDRLAAALAAERWSDDAAIRVMTASTEALANALEHGSGPGARVEMAFRVTRRAASVRVTDAGRPGRPADLEHEPEAPSKASTRGRGRLLMRALADEVRIRRRGPGTEVRLGFGRHALA
ncbi:MAG TPA: ATP-binding protein [Miltoncostaeaceae bacterium]|nr:ATP-binding protein [Miltoncostaeaceae bacterium]